MDLMEDAEDQAGTELAVADEIDVDQSGMVSTELAQQILEDVWSNGQPLEEKRPEIAKRWKQVQRETGKVRFENFLECYYFEDKTAEPFEINEETSWACGEGKCPGPWFMEWGFFWAFYLPAVICVVVCYKYMLGDDEKGEPNVYNLHPQDIINYSFYGSWVAMGLVVMVALVRAHVIGSQSKGVIINGKLVQTTSRFNPLGLGMGIAFGLVCGVLTLGMWQGFTLGVVLGLVLSLVIPLKWFLEDNEDAARKEDIGQMSHILGLIIGPFLVVTVIATCLFFVVQGVVMKLDYKGEYMDPERCLDPDTGMRIDLGTLSDYPERGCTAEEYEQERHGSCISPIGYFGTISGVSANIMPQGYVFMFVTITTNALVILTHMPPFGILQGVQDNDKVDLAKRQWEEGYFPNKSFIFDCFMIRLGLVFTCFTAVLPDFAEGIFQASVTMSNYHLWGIELGIALTLIGVLKYMLTAMHLRTTNDNHAKHMDRPLLWAPHVVTMWIVWMTLAMVVGFVAANSKQPRYDNYHNQCLLRSTHIAETAFPESEVKSCGLPAGFNKTGYRVVTGYPYFDLNLTCTFARTSSITDAEHPVGYDFYYNKGITIHSVGPCTDPAYGSGQTCVTINVTDGLPFIGETVMEEYQVDGSEMPKNCELSNDGTLCMDTECHFHEFKVGFTFEFALLFLMMVLCQLFVVTFHFDWQIHDPLIVVERAADAPTGASLKNRDVMILGGADRNVMTIGESKRQ
jgi:hypothetical protein